MQTGHAQHEDRQDSIIGSIIRTCNHIQCVHAVLALAMAVIDFARVQIEFHPLNNTGSVCSGIMMARSTHQKPVDDRRVESSFTVRLVRVKPGVAMQVLQADTEHGHSSCHAASGSWTICMVTACNSSVSIVTACLCDYDS